MQVAPRRTTLKCFLGLSKYKVRPLQKVLMKSTNRFAFCYLLIFLALSCYAQQFPAIPAAPAIAVSNDPGEMPATAANLLGSGRSADYSDWPLPYIYGGLALSAGAGYSPAAGKLGGGLNLESARLIALAETSVENAHKQDSGTGTELDLKGRAFVRASAGWYFGGGAQWSKLSTILYDKQAWRPTFGGGKDLFRENFSMRAQVLYVLPGSDHLNAVQGPEISLWVPSPASRSHLFYRQTLAIDGFHQTSVPGNSGVNERYLASFLEFTAMYRF